MGNVKDKYEKDLLTHLVEKYERSAGYNGSGKQKRGVFCKPSEVFKRYDDPAVNVDEIEVYDEAMETLRKKGFVNLIFRSRMEHPGEVVKLSLETEKYPEIVDFLGIEAKRDTLAEAKKLYESFLGINEILDGYCQRQLTSIEEGKLPAASKNGSAGIILAMVKRILENDKFILERELSQEVAKDSKAFSKIKLPVCKILAAGSTSYADTKSLKDVLRQYGVYENEPYVNIKGPLHIYFKNGEEMILSVKTPVALSLTAVYEIEFINVLGGASVMTVENLTAYTRLADENTVYVYTEGYHGRCQEAFLKTLFSQGKDVVWRHFGDIDPDGYAIAKNLQDKLGKKVLLFKMGIPEIEKYRGYGKELTTKDRKKAERMAADKIFEKELEAVLESGIKIEQEIIAKGEEGRTI